MLKPRMPIMSALLFPLSLYFTAEALGACELPAKRPFQKSFQPQDAFDTAAFINSAVRDLGDGLMGYVVVLRGKAGKIVAEANYGYARTPCEEAGVQPFTRDTQTAWGSVTKMFTTAAVIDKTERSNVRNLDEKMFEFLPERWRKDVHPENREVTIRHLLSYQSGFKQKAPDDVDPKDFAERLSRPPEKKIGTRAYSNESFAIFHYMGRFFQEGHWDHLEAGYKPGEIDYDSYVLGHGLAIYKQVIRDRIFNPLPIKGSCNDSDHAGKNYSHYYNSAQSKKGYFLNPQDHSGCATGGIVMSAEDMGKFLHALTRTDAIVSRENHKKLLAVPTDDVLGWNGSPPVQDGEAFHKAGGRTLSGTSIPGNTASGRAGADIIAFPSGLSAVIAINSKRPEEMKGLKEILIDAYNTGVKGKRSPGPKRLRGVLGLKSGLKGPDSVRSPRI